MCLMDLGHYATERFMYFDECNNDKTKYLMSGSDSDDDQMSNATETIAVITRMME